MLLGRALRRGEWPLWTDTQLCGYPFVGNGQSALFYPPNWLYAAADPRRGLALVAALHFALAALLCFAYCRCLGLRRAPAMLAAWAFGAGGFMVGLTPLPTLMNTAAWLPGCLLGVELCVRGRGPRGAAALGACTGMAFLAGHLQIAAYVLLTTVLYAGARVVGMFRVRSARRVGALVGGLALGGLLGAGQLAPSVELGGLSPRGAGAPSTEALVQFHMPRALQPAELPTLVYPDALGTPARGDYRGMKVAPGAAYGERCGYVGALTLALGLAGLAAGRGRLRLAFACAAALALWAAMGGPPAWLIYFGVPKVGLTGGFTRLLCLYTFFAACLGGVGLDGLLRRLQERRPRWRLPLGAAAVAVVAVELIAWGWRTLPSPPAQALYPETRATRFLQAHVAPGDRLLAVTPRAEWVLHRRPEAVLPPNSATAYPGLCDVQGYDSLFPLSYDRLAGAIERGPRSPAANGNMVLLENTASPLLDLAGVRWLVTRASGAPSEPDSAVLSGVSITARPRAFPRAFLVEPGVAAGPQAHDRLARGPRPTGVPVRFAGCNALTAQTPRRDEAAALVVTNTAYPGWRAWADGRQVPVRSIGGVFQQVALPAGGPCRVMLAYVPATVQVGLFLLLCAVGVLAGLWCSAAASRRPRTS